MHISLDYGVGQEFTEAIFDSCSVDPRPSSRARRGSDPRALPAILLGAADEALGRPLGLIDHEPEGRTLVR